MPVTREKVDTSFEDKILIGMITSKEYLSGIDAIYQSTYLESLFGRQVAGWCFDYFDEYDKAPGVHIEDLFDAHIDELDIDTSEMIKVFLNRISSEYEKAPYLNVEYLLKETEAHFKKKSLQSLSEDINAAIEQNEDLDAIYAFLDEEKSNRIDICSTAFADSMVKSDDLLVKKIKPPKAILYPWLRERSLNMIFAERGLGKSWLAMIIGVAITRRNYEDLSVGPWFVKNQTGVLYVDGEMGEFDLKDRIKQIAEPLGKESRRYPLVTFSAPDYTEAHNESVNLNSAMWQDRFFNYLQDNRSIRVLILDNLASLCAGREENDNQQTSMLNQWFIKLRAAGITVVIIHHAGKTPGQQRGASALEDPLNNSIYLSKPKGWKQGGGAHFGISFVKARNDSGGDAFRAFTLRVVEHDENHKWRRWEEAE